MRKKFKDLKKGDHLYIPCINYKTYEPMFCEYELVTDMEFVENYVNEVLCPDEILPIYRCFIIPINYDPKHHYYEWDGKNPIEFKPGWKWNYDGGDTQICTCLEDAKNYYLKYFASNAINKLDKEISKLENKISKLKNIRGYHLFQKHKFDFNRSYEYDK